MIKQHQSQRQQMKILPQQIQLLNLYFLNSLELEQRIRNEIEENPFLEEGKEEPEPQEADLSPADQQDYQSWEEKQNEDQWDYRSEYQPYFSREQTPDWPLASHRHFRDEAKQQLRMILDSEEEIRLGESLIDALNNRGLMDKDLEEVADDLSFVLGRLVDLPQVENMLSKIQTLDPVGLGSRSIKDCLIVQLKELDPSRWEVKQALILLNRHYEDLVHRQFEKIHHGMGLGNEDLRVLLQLIGGLRFYPVYETAGNAEPLQTIVPDFQVYRVGDEIQANLYKSRSASVAVNQRLYEQLARECGQKDKGSTQYIRSKLQSAEWFVQAVRQRESTMMTVMRALVDMQAAYFMEGDIRLLRPMVLRHVAERTGLDISTISRVTSNKYAETHFGLIGLKQLFSEGIADQKGNVISNKVIQSAIEEAIDREDKSRPFTDQELVHYLSKKGYKIARRTVAKYREQLKIPIAQIRAVWA